MLQPICYTANTCRVKGKANYKVNNLPLPFDCVKHMHVCTTDEAALWRVSQLQKYLQTIARFIFVRGAQEHWQPRTGQMLNLQRELDNCQCVVAIIKADSTTIGYIPYNLVPLIHLSPLLFCLLCHS